MTRPVLCGALFGVALLLLESVPSRCRAARAERAIAAATQPDRSFRIPIAALATGATSGFVIDPYDWDSTMRQSITELLPPWHAFRTSRDANQAIDCLLVAVDASGHCVDVLRVPIGTRIDGDTVVRP